MIRFAKMRIKTASLEGASLPGWSESGVRKGGFVARLLPLAGLVAGALMLSLASFGWFLPSRIEEASFNGMAGCVVIPICHLAAVSAPLLILGMRRTWWSLMLFGLS